MRWFASFQVVLVGLLLVPGCKDRSKSTASPSSKQTSQATEPAAVERSRPNAPAPATPTNEPASGTNLPEGHPPIPPNIGMMPPAGQPATQPAIQTTSAPTPWMGKDVAWVVPAGWVQESGSGMRFATVKPASGGPSIAVTNFPGDVGGDLANINRWRGQIKLPPIAQAQLADLITALKAGEIEVKMVDLKNEQAGGQRMLAVIVPHGGKTWFAKMVGPDQAVETQEEAFTQFVKSIRFASQPPGGGE